MRYVHLTKTKHVHTRQTHSLVRESVTKRLWLQGFSCTKNIQVVSLKGLGAKKNCLATKRSVAYSMYDVTPVMFQTDYTTLLAVLLFGRKKLTESYKTIHFTDLNLKWKTVETYLPHSRGSVIIWFKLNQSEPIRTFQTEVFKDAQKDTCWSVWCGGGGE
jgi:hypothetical protein